MAYFTIGCEVGFFILYFKIFYIFLEKVLILVSNFVIINTWLSP